MGFWDHLNELRGTLVRCVLALLGGVLVVAFQLDAFNDVLMWPLRHVQANFPGLEVDVNTYTPMEPFTVIIQTCLIGGAVIAAPFILFFLGQFVAPALTESERRTVLPLAGTGLLLFVGGCIFSFWLLVPSTLQMSLELNVSRGWDPQWSVVSYFKLLTWLVLGVGLCFEFPLVIVALVHFGLMTTAFLRKYRRHAIVAIFIIAAIVTPTPDPMVQCMFAAPLYVLYEAAIVAGIWIEKRRAARLAE
jgi:sec-independent protein translocase protein TatC